jgi:Uma2 family endonuclease
MDQPVYTQVALVGDGLLLRSGAGVPTGRGQYAEPSSTGPDEHLRRRYAMAAEMVAPAWMHTQISAEQYDSWSEEQCAGIEIVDGMVVVSPSASKRHNRLARILANALDAASGPDWNADFDVRLQDAPLTNRRPDVIVYRAETIDLTPTRPEHVLLVVEVVSPGSETTDRIVKADQYAKAGIPFYWRIEQAATGVPIVYTYVLDPAGRGYRDSEVFTGMIKAAAPFSVTVDLGSV